MKKTSFIERRKYPRVELKKRVPGKIKTGIEGTIVDISQSGVLVEITTPIKIGSECNLEIDLNGKRFIAQGKVERVFVHSLKEDAIIYRAGIKFENITNNQLKLLNEYLKDLSGKKEENE
ncbi:PilZ domain-containing protein [Candidatus Aminicenantes bacterium AC-335-B20]|jgi:c-di-GMP-binding flagellar brake protein YcgR|nr:PilZ domain-containing protein [SCandidatus Aminicenantes bacterium Aminicenantia_JdfR_composite]MCP2596347.1 PilZ domain-containing protein [Candidatus Aminicenantes bacterium AC-335-G13]MCP2599015.1 PilZ domain-containing protein [Candidatus Aminicenantes bacterium AC-335-B20]MCP2605412.1 PilZ domain-containing protein [Candidatus Aminicenantes bacterium AC-335-O07]MCP2605978.1 PilZ domain-containing protein [Candidatus Aminicenantes bacterium AC-708-I09]MCP2617821.1 PilZ domain-containin